ncbi:unnamed protein product [Durusdinium trenchii]|uniref:Uncharacterized protein n=1 Tax=Durusdinium trenchii TaxID=1381693 RepID=A0ABP0IVU5_9DINO
MARKDEEVEKFVQQNSDQLLWPIWPGLTHVERADVFRYLVLWKEGGYYADANVECMKPIDEWGIPNEATMIAGYEFGHRLPEEDRKLFQFARTEQFEQWFLASAPGNPVLLRCMELVRQRYSWKLQDTLQLSGAGVWSDAVHEFLARTVPEVLEKEVAFRSNKSAWESRPEGDKMCRVGVSLPMFLDNPRNPRIHLGLEDWTCSTPQTTNCHHTCRQRQWLASNLIAMASNRTAMASNLIAMASQTHWQCPF